MINSLIKAFSLLNILNKKGTSPLIIAVEKKNLTIARKLLEAGADPNFRDIKQRTSLHIAFNVSDISVNASFDMESLLLLFKADINALDCRNRVPLHYSFIKIGKPDDIQQIDPIESVSSACSLGNIKVNVQDDWKKTPLHYAAQRGALTSTMFLLSKGAELDLEDSNGNTALALSIKEGHANYAIMLVQKGANVMNIVNVPKLKEKKLASAANYGVFGGGLFGNSFGQNYYQQNNEAKLAEGTYSMFKAAIIQGWQGLAYLLLFHGYPYMLAMQDAMTQNKFLLVKTLLAKVSDNSVLQQVNENGQNLFHTLAIYGSGADNEIAKIICDQLIDRNVDTHVLDNFGRNPLHYAAKSGSYYFCSFFLGQGVRHDIFDNEQFCPLAYAINDKKIRNSMTMLQLFVNSGASLSFMFKEKGVMTTPLLYSIKTRSPAILIKFLLDNGCSLAETDGKGCTAFMYAIINNDTELVKALITEGTLNLMQTDNVGRNALHYAIQPFEYGSYENTKILEVLLMHNTNVHTSDNKGTTPYILACNQRSEKMLNVMKALNIKGNKPIPRKNSAYEADDDEFDYLGDAEEYIKIQSDIKKVIDLKRTPDENGSFPLYYEVFEDYDLMMTKVDLSYGPYSAYVFYRMQLLIDTNRDVYILYTRWGRIGEVGASQRTPFSVKDEAVAEFQKIFKSKSGNEWGAPFERKTGKYVMMKLELQQIKCKDFISEFNLITAPESNLTDEVKEAVKSFSSQTLYRALFNSYNLNVNILNFSNLSKETIDKAEHILLEISKRSKQMETENETSAKIEIIQEIQDLSSRYYELMPAIHQTNSAIPPIIQQDVIAQHIAKINLLRNVELASKVILGALYQQLAINPYDYIYRCLDTNITSLPKDSDEGKLIIKYYKRGGGSGNLLSIFKLQRKGESEKIVKYQHEKNRKLLWHGTSSANIVGILMQGLKIAPPEVPNSGYMFGKGVYFADYFGKSQGFCSKEFNNTAGYFILLCEVVLGNMLVKYNAEFIEKLPEEYLSTLGYGNQAPNPLYSIHTPYGVEAPVGKLISQKIEGVYNYLGFNEYIVYDTAQIRIRYLLHLKD